MRCTERAEMTGFKDMRNKEIGHYRQTLIKIFPPSHHFPSLNQKHQKNQFLLIFALIQLLYFGFGICQQCSDNIHHQNLHVMIHVPASIARIF